MNRALDALSAPLDFHSPKAGMTFFYGPQLLK